MPGSDFVCLRIAVIGKTRSMRKEKNKRSKLRIFAEDFMLIFLPDDPNNKEDNELREWTNIQLIIAYLILGFLFFITWFVARH